MTRHDATRRYATLRNMTWHDVRSVSQRNKNELYCMWDGWDIVEKLIKPFRSEAFYRRCIKSAPVSIKPNCPKYRFCHPIGQMDLSCPWTVQDEILQKCRETIPLVQVCFRFELSFTVLKLLLKIGVNPWNFDRIFTVFSVFSAKMASEEI